MTQVKKDTVIHKTEEQKNEILKKVLVPKFEDVLKENENLKKELAKKTLSQKPEDLEELLKFFEERNLKIKELKFFETRLQKLNELQKSVEKSLTSGDFVEVQNIYFSISAPTGEYDRIGEIIKINNYEVLKDVLQFVNTLIIHKVEKLQSEIKS